MTGTNPRDHRSAVTGDDFREHRAAAPGDDFRDHRSVAPGDDFREHRAVVTGDDFREYRSAVTGDDFREYRPAVTGSVPECGARELPASLRFEAPPACFTGAILAGADRIRASERRKKALLRGAAAAAACLALAAVGLTALRPRPMEDAVLTEQPSPATLSEVWAHPDDPYCHAGPECGLCRADAVKMGREAAAEFGKSPCESCMGGDA